MEPVVITPQVYKRTNAWPFAVLWAQARRALAHCRRLVVIGYSLPPTDFPAVRLLLESFAENRVDELTVINPDASVSERLARLVRPAQSLRHDSLHAYCGVHEVDEFGRFNQEHQKTLPKMPRQPLVRNVDALRAWASHWDEAANVQPDASEQ